MRLLWGAPVLLLVLMAGCGGDSFTDVGCNGSCTDSSSALSVSDVERVVAAAAAEAQRRNAPATIAVVDRVGNVLAVYAMTGADADVTVRSPRSVRGGLEGIRFIPSSLAAISKAVTGAYLSSEGNAFSTRTAGQIVQEHFNPGEDNQPAGPLFGVQFSQLACSDLVTSVSDGSHGPKRAPLGLAADPGGFPLYRGGAVVGGIGVVADGRYSFDADLSDFDVDLDELIALAGTRSLVAPENRRADRITVDGKQLRFSDARFDQLPSLARSIPALGSISGALLDVPGYFTAGGGIQAGVAFGQSVSGIRPDTENTFPGQNAWVLVDGTDTPRYPPTAANDGPDGLSAAEVQAILSKALAVAESSRAQIRRPLSTNARVSIFVVDRNGVVLGFVRSKDAPVFGIDVALQKARTAAFYSGSQGATELSALPDASYLGPELVGGLPQVIETVVLGDYVSALSSFLGLPNALNDGAFAFTDRAGGNLSRPFYPDGIQGNGPGPLSKPFNRWSPFSTGLQLDLVYNQLIAHVAFAAGLSGADVATGCSTISRSTPGPTVDPLANGIQIFPGSVPIYRGSTLVGGIGVSGDGVDQDDMIAFLGLHRAAAQLGTVNNAPGLMRADQLQPGGVRLRYVQCPQAPFLGSEVQNVCDGK